MAHLQVEQLSVSFGGLKAVNEVSFEVAEGAIHGLIGPNGAGKTTIFNCVSGLYKPQRGTIRFAGHDLTPLKPHQVAQCGIARTFQNIELFRNMTVLDNLLVGQHTHLQCGIVASALALPWGRREAEQSRVRVRQIMQFLGLEEVQHHLAASLAFGHQKLIELGRALALEPRLLLLDEPASGMNPQETAALRLLIEDVRRRLGITILLVEHDMGLVMKVCDRISVLNFGIKLTPCGRPRALTRRTPWSRRCIRDT